MQIAHKQRLDVTFWQQQLLDMEPTISIVLASSGYPFSTSKSAPINLAGTLPDTVKLYFASTFMDNRQKLSSGPGRVMCLSARADTIEAACALGYGLLPEIDFAGMRYRSDIGKNITSLTNCLA